MPVPMTHKECKNFIKAYVKCDYNYAAVARVLGISASAARDRYNSAVRRFPDLAVTKPTRYATPTNVPAANPLETGNKLTWDDLSELVQLWASLNCNAAAAARASGLETNTAQSRLRTARRRFPAEVKQLVEAHMKEEPKPEEVPVEDRTKEHRVQQEMRGLRLTVKKLTATIADMEDEIADLSWANSVSYDPAEWSLPDHPTHKSEHMPYLLTSDFHCGEVVSAEETGAGYGYDSSIFVERYRTMIEVAIYLSMSHSGENWTFPGFIYARAGDTISGQLHPELIETDDMTPIEAVQLVAEEEMGGIRKLLDAFGKVEVKTVGVGGNHDRDLFKPTTKGAHRHSFETLISAMLMREFRNEPNVTFHTSKSFDLRFPIYNKNILLTHGDRIGTRGGQGFIGPAATILRGAQKVATEQSDLGYRVDRVDLGHFHYPFQAPGVLSNGSMPGYTEYAKQFRMKPNKPQQWLVFHHPRRGEVDYKPIILA